VITDLNDLIPPDSSWTLITAFGIDQQGRSVGLGTHAGQRRAFLLLPPRMEER
jgi:hypothetical protein